MIRLGMGLLAALVVSDAQGAPSVRKQLDRTWESYKTRFIQADGRVMDPKSDNATTSEGQSYALARAAWMDDRPTFERVWTWTRDNLQAGNPTALPAWRWGRRADGSWGVMDPQPAADADQWIAWSLLLAAQRWEEPTWRAQARGLLERIWADEVATIGGRSLLLPGPWAREADPIRLNPSYFMFFAWRDFARLDPTHPWLTLVDTAYDLLESTPGRLPSDWMYVGANGQIQDAAEDARIFSFDAFRTFWNVAADHRWNAEPRARDLLVAWTRILDAWRMEGRIPARLSTSGGSLADFEYPGMLGAILPGWHAVDKHHATVIYRDHLAPLWTGTGWGDPDDYYAQNQVWFGLALCDGRATPLEAP